MGIHHAGKNQEAGARGASAWRANVDNMLSCAADRNEMTGECKNRRLSVSKYRDGVEGPVSGYELKSRRSWRERGRRAVRLMRHCRRTQQDFGSTKTRKTIGDERLFDAAFNEAAIDLWREIPSSRRRPKRKGRANEARPRRVL